MRPRSGKAGGMNLAQKILTAVMVAIFAFFGFFFISKSMAENERARPELFMI
jgi:hypothetical protein